MVGKWEAALENVELVSPLKRLAVGRDNPLRIPELPGVRQLFVSKASRPRLGRDDVVANIPPGMLWYAVLTPIFDPEPLKIFAKSICPLPAPMIDSWKHELRFVLCRLWVERSRPVMRELVESMVEWGNVVDDGLRREADIPARFRDAARLLVSEDSAPATLEHPKAPLLDDNPECGL